MYSGKAYGLDHPRLIIIDYPRELIDNLFMWSIAIGERWSDTSVSPINRINKNNSPSASNISIYFVYLGAIKPFALLYLGFPSNPQPRFFKQRVLVRYLQDYSVKVTMKLCVV
jgi:hypothetical protein